MLCFIALDLILRVIRARVMCVALVVNVFGVHPYDFPADPTDLGIPAYVIADFKIFHHQKLLIARGRCVRLYRRTYPARQRSRVYA
jgi:hypothetical protein